ncbi:hypothetical protein Dimus_001306 [Dionaea muscipula]
MPLYYMEVLNRALRCQSCKTPFIAYDMCAQGVPMGTNAAKHPCTKQEIPNQASSKFAANDGVHGQQNSRKEPLQREDAVPKTSNLPEATHEVDKAGSSAGGPKPPRKVNGKRRKMQVVESSESLDSSSMDMEEGIGINEDDDIILNSFAVDAESRPRRSTRSKQHVSYNECVSDDDEVLNLSKQPMASMDENFEGTSLKESPNLAKSSDMSVERADSVHQKRK